jgi:hypothetical protein
MLMSDQQKVRGMIGTRELYMGMDPKVDTHPNIHRYQCGHIIQCRNESRGTYFHIFACRKKSQVWCCLDMCAMRYINRT